MPERDDLILNHIGRYTVSIRAVMEKLFFEGRDCDHVINRLQKEGRLQSIPLIGNLSAYQLTLKEARSRGMEYRGRASVTVNTLRGHLAALWFCCMAGHRRKRLLEREAKAALELPDNQRLISAHVLHVDAEETTIYRLYTPEGDIDRFVDQLITDSLRVGRDDLVLSAWAERGTYQFAILSDRALRQEQLQECLEPKLCELPVKLHFETVPPYYLLADAIRALRERTAHA